MPTASTLFAIWVNRPNSFLAHQPSAWPLSPRRRADWSIDLKRGVACGPVDLLVAFKHQFDEVQNSRDVGVIVGESGDLRKVERVDLFEASGKLRAWEAEAFDHVGVVLREPWS